MTGVLFFVLLLALSGSTVYNGHRRDRQERFEFLDSRRKVKR